MAATAIPVETIPSIDPATGKILGQFEKTPPAELPQILARARAAQSMWSAVPIERRCAQLGELREHMMA
ncbi:MAG TPA: aldehyde dehydrogenase family protein, partial [Candidatus Acidoferrum sp.]|nr:aldehyde dehydrogenase family protein [Candidatus Acidoferrum sp.]